MTQILNFNEAHAELKKYIPAVKEITGKDITLTRMWPLMKLLGNPEAKLKVIHIAGTSGKTSTAYYIASLLQAAGQKVGLTISPHVDSVAERVQINLLPLSEAEFCSALGEFLTLIEKLTPRPTYFELMIAFVYWYFAKAEVDYAVIETGLGGLHDATNVAGRSDKVCVITDIGIDHTKVLGKTIKEITAQKAGIIHGHNKVLCYKQSPVVMKVLREVSSSQHGMLQEISPRADNDLTLALPLFQRRNWTLARTVSDYVVDRDQLPLLTHDQLLGTLATRIPARMELVSYHDKTIIIDGAHNPQKLHALVASLRHNYPDQPVAVLAGFVKSRKPRLQGNIRALLTVASCLIATSFVPNQEMYTNSADPQQIARYCRELGFANVEIEPEPEAAFAKLLNRPEPVLLIAGSFYLLHHIRPLILAKDD